MADYFQGSRQPDPIVLSRRRKMLALSLAALTMVALPMPAWAQTEPKPFSPEELDQMLAPIALYDDALLSQVLMAAGYPLEIVEAARWSQANPNLKGDAAVTAVADKTWDVSVKSLVAFPSVLKQLSDHLDWTQKLGDALIGQQADVATSIQRLRAKAAAAGTLKTGKEQTVTTQTQGSDTTIAIQPTDPEVVYVPTYDPNTAYGQWSNPSYPPTSYPTGGALMSGLAWGVGIAAAGAMFSSWNWNSGGSGNYVNVNANRATNIDRNYNRANVGTGGRWQHDASHRKGVAYRDPAARQQYGQNRPGADQRQQFRGQTDQAARTGGAGGPGGAGRPGGRRWSRWSGPARWRGRCRRSRWRRRSRRRGPARWRGRCRWSRWSGSPWWRRRCRWSWECPAAGGRSRRRWWKWPLRSRPRPAGEPRVPARSGPAAKGGAAAQRWRRRWPSRRRRRWWWRPGRRRWRTAMSKMIRGVFLALVLCVGLSAAALAQPQAPAPQLRGFPTAGGGGRRGHRSDPQQRRQGDDRHPGLDVARVRARRRPR